MAGGHRVQERIGMTGSSNTGIVDWSFLGVNGYGAILKLIDVPESCSLVSVLMRWPA